jgi:hypothetical protein
MHKCCSYAFCIALCLLLAGCAQVRSISGGEKDTTPPALIASSPPYKTLNFTENSFTLSFDEYVQLRDIQKELLVSPPLKSAPKVKVRQRSVFVSWNDTLRANATYIFQFGNAIADVNESNVQSDLNYVFATGNTLDSLMCKGRVVDAFADKPVKAMKVLLFDSLPQLFNTSSKPAYFSRTNDNGEFEFNYLRNGNYVLCALSDENGNNHFDTGEAIDWKLNVVAGTKQDSLSHALFTSIPRDSLNNRFDYLTDSSGVLKFRVEPWTPVVRVMSLAGDSIIQWMSHDTLFATTSRLCGNRQDIAIMCGGKITDTLSIRHINDDVSAMKVRALLKPKMTMSEAPVVESKRPIYLRNDSLLKCFADSVEIPCSSSRIHALRYDICFERKPGKSYSIVALPGWLTDDCGETNDTLRFRYTCYESNELGTLRFKFSPDIIKRKCIFELVDRAKKVVFATDNVETQELTLDQLIPGDYTAILCFDSNENGYFDPLVIEPFRPTERKLAYNGNIQVRANWEVVIDWTEFTP